VKRPITKGHIESFRLALPPLQEQRAIAHTLGTLDDKIELNRRMNVTLEAIARALFKSWFLDFDPVRAKVDGRDPGLPSHLADLFPDSFEKSELVETPTGWMRESFADTIEIISGGTPRTEVLDYWEGTIPWFSVVDAPRDADVWVIDTQKKITAAGVENSAARLLAAGTTIVTARGTVGRVALVGVPMAMNQSCYGLRGKIGSQGFFTYFMARDQVANLRRHAHGSVFDTITRDTFAGVPVVVPPTTIVSVFEGIALPLLERIRTGLVESRTLAALRDTLLPKLLSGERRLSSGDLR
jgi:type I restriction enzyme S subunit